MENKFKIIVSYIKDLSVEIPSPEALVTIRNTIPEYKMKVDINTKPLKRKMIEVLTTLTFENPDKKKEKGFFQIAYANVIEILDLKINKADLENNKSEELILENNLVKYEFDQTGQLISMYDKVLDKEFLWNIFLVFQYL